MNKNALKSYAVWARVQLIEQVKQKAFEYGITEDGYGDENARTIGTRALSNAEVAQRAELVSQIKAKGYKQVIEEVAYTWFNRFIALRYMEVNGYLPSRVRMFTNENNAFEPEILKEAISIELDGLDKNIVFDLIEKQDNDALYKYLLITQCNALNPLLPGMFEKISNYTELLFPNNLLRSDSVLGKMISDIPEEDWTEQVEVLGWLYQYYISEKHDEIINIFKGNIKKEDVPAATQLFTTDWVVRYMVDNSLGRYWIERNPQSKLAEKLDFFVTPKDGKFNYIDEKVSPTDLTFFDPCMGSGHILVYAFDVLMEIYKECGYTERDAAQSILENNLYGLDIDDRAYQLAYFAVMMKARYYDRKILTRGIKPNVYSIQESNFLQGSWYKISSDAKFKDVFKEVVNTFIDAKDYGSILDVPAKDYDYAMSVIDDFEQHGIIDFETQMFLDNIDVIRTLIGQAKVMSKKYVAVVTNPPYMNKYDAKLKDYILEHFADYKGDLFSVFMYHNFAFCSKNGYSAFMTPFVWMFIKTYEELRRYIIQNKSITTLVQMEYSAFEEATVPVCTFVLKNEKNTTKGLYFRLSDFKGGMEVQKQKVLEAINNKDCGYFYQTDENNFSKIPGSPIAYWVSDNMLKVYDLGKILGEIAFPKTGMTTGDNNRFLRFWYEVGLFKVNFNSNSSVEAKKSQKKWFPYCKGGGFRRWYGYNEYLVNWYNDGYEIKNNIKDNGLKAASVRSENMYFKPLITWSAVTSGLFSCRYCFGGSLFDSGGSSIAAPNNTYYLLALLNSKVGQYILNISNSTINYQPGDIAGISVIFDNVDIIESKAQENIAISKMDWDSFETSWDFEVHPLVRLRTKSKERTNGGDWQYRISNAYNRWEEECEDRFNQLKANEEELNRIFIDIYGLQDELTPEVEDKDVTVRKADLQRDIKSLISYAIGCMFGRYSIEAEGLQYAGGDFNEWYNSLSANSHQLTANIVDLDNIIPICDDEYFEDDIVGKFIDFIKVVYGEETLEENLRFIADALGGKGTPREVIRNYFLNDFYKDHCKIYQKRPIYWMFDSGKKNGFKALVYMHRYQPDTIARMRTDYVHEQQERYRTLSESLSIEYDTATGTDRTRIGKQIDKLKDQLIEIGAFEEKVHHLADQMIDIDLDDGVKVNYAKFGDVLGKIK